MNSFLLKAWFGAIISLFTIFLPTSRPQPKISTAPLLVHAVPRHSIRKIAPAAKPALKADKPEAVRTMKISQPTYLFSISGVALEQGVPNRNAELTLLITTPYGQEIHKLLTASDGSYSLMVPIHAKANDPVDWEIKGQAVDYKTIDRVGRQIALMDESLVSVQNTLNFIAK